MQPLSPLVLWQVWEAMAFTTMPLSTTTRVGRLALTAPTHLACTTVRGTFTNAATLTIGAAASVGQYGLENNAAFTNNTGGQIKIDRSTEVGLLNDGGTFINEAAVTIGAVAPVGPLVF
jgi:hypothetical protein